MKEEVTDEDVTILVRGFFYKIPYYILAHDAFVQMEASPFMRDLQDEDITEENISQRLKNWCTGKDDLTRRHTLIMIKATVSLHEELYYSFRYVKFSDHDDVKDACKAYVHQFEDDDTLTRLKRELAFYAGDQFRIIKTQKDATR